MHLYSPVQSWRKFSAVLYAAKMTIHEPKLMIIPAEICSLWNDVTEQLHLEPTRWSFSDVDVHEDDGARRRGHCNL
jgi:hypothetical protein